MCEWKSFGMHIRSQSVPTRHLPAVVMEFHVMDTVLDTRMQKVWIVFKTHCDCVCVVCVFLNLFSVFQSTFVNRPALGILPPENFPDKISESLLSVSNTHIHTYTNKIHQSEFQTLER